MFKETKRKKILCSSTDIPIADLLHNRMPSLTHVSLNKTRQTKQIS